VYNEGRFGSSGYWFNQMYYGENGPFKRASAGKAITFENDKVVVHGFMESDTYTPLLNISVIPVVPLDLAPSVRKKLYGHTFFFKGLPGQARTSSSPNFLMFIFVIILVNWRNLAVS